MMQSVRVLHLHNAKRSASSTLLVLARGGSRSGSASGGGKIVFQSTSTKATALEDKEEKSEDAVVKKKKQTQYLWDLGLPTLVPEWKHMFNKETMFTDISAGLTVGCIAVPLSLAIALASGVPAEVGLVTAAVSGIAGGLMGGTTLAVTGPAAAISLLVVDAVQQHGLEALPFITFACGGLQLASGVTRLGVVAKLVPVSVIAGFTTGIGTLILTGQLPKALGMGAVPAGMNPVELLAYVGSNLNLVSAEAASLAIGTSLAMYLLPKLHPKMPSALLAVGGATLTTHSLGMDTVALIGTLPSGLEAFQFGMPIMPPTDSLPSLCTTVALIYAMTSVESLLSCAALEKMKATTYKHNPDQELVGQGLANLGAAMFMGMPVTSVIARSSLNVKLNASTRLPALVQAGFVFSSVVFLSDSIAMVPMPALSGVLIMTGLNMLNPIELKHCYAVQKSDAIPFVTTIGGMLSLGLAEGIGVGCISAFALNYGKGTTIEKMQSQHTVLNTNDMQELLALDDWKATDDKTQDPVWNISGPINFVGMFAIDNLIAEIKDKKPTDGSGMNICLDMSNVTTVEFTGVEELVNRLVEAKDENDSLTMVNVNDPALRSALDLCDPKKLITRLPAKLRESAAESK